MRALVLLLAALMLAAPALAQDIPEPMVMPEAPEIDPESLEAEALTLLDDVIGDNEPGAGDDAAPPADPEKPGFADRVRDAFYTEAVAFSAAGLAAILVSVGGFAAVTRYISPKEALKNPQRSMLYGFIRGNPGVHLKQLSEEFAMKTSSILWHIRKLESAELVNSERVNGYRVFYPCEGGVEVKRVSRALAALQNDNAARVYGYVQHNPGATAATLTQRLGLHGGTARWHLRKLREHGLLDELIQEDASRFYPTHLGKRALEAREGRPADAPKTTAIPSD